MANKVRPKLDRFATLKAMFADIGALRSDRIDGIAGGSSAPLAFAAFWAHCDGKTGQVIMTVSRLAKLTGLTRDTARRCVAILERNNYILPVKKDGKPVPARWIVNHSLKEEIE